MSPSSPKSAIDIHGFEYDWLGCDADGCVALFSTAGEGHAPSEFLRDTDAHYEAIQAILELPATTEARFFPELAAGLENSWRLVAERGLYAYDWDLMSGGYCLVAAPGTAASAAALPAIAVAVASRIKASSGFASQTLITAARLRELVG